jgi:sugar O-acyltransferase (sialic acid O-acetyltransferase NeuD family)
MRVVIVGAGGHAQVVADSLRCMRQSGQPIQIVGYLDDAAHLHGRKILEDRVLGSISYLSQIPHDGVVVAIGDNGDRCRCFEKLKASGVQLITVRHPHSTVAADVEIGPGCMIFAGVVVNTGTVIGENVILNTACTIDHHNRIGSHAHIAPGAHTGGEVNVGEGTLIGLGAAIMPRCRLGSWSTVGAGALVNRDLPDSVTAIGVPAKVIHRR